MADLSDVENTIGLLIAGLLYPNGTSQPSAVLNDAGNPLPVAVVRGWPEPADVDKQMALGNAIVSVFSRGTGKNTTRYPIDYHDLPAPAPTVSVSINNNVATNQITITGNGSAAVTQYVTVNISGKIAVSYSVLATDTAATIAAALAAQITSAYVTATNSGASISVASSAFLSAFVGVAVPQLAEVRRQVEQMQISIWCPTPKTRDNVAIAIEPTLANTVFLTLPDQSAARFRYAGVWVGDEKQTVQIYRRDNLYDVEYGTTLTDTGYEVTAVQVNQHAGQESIPVTAATPTVTTIYPEPGQPAGNPSFIAEQGNS